MERAAEVSESFAQSADRDQVNESSTATTHKPRTGEGCGACALRIGYIRRIAF